METEEVIVRLQQIERVLLELPGDPQQRCIECKPAMDSLVLLRMLLWELKKEAKP